MRQGECTGKSLSAFDSANESFNEVWELIDGLSDQFKLDAPRPSENEKTPRAEIARGGAWEEMEFLRCSAGLGHDPFDHQRATSSYLDERLLSMGDLENLAIQRERRREQLARKWIKERRTK